MLHSIHELVKQASSSPGGHTMALSFIKDNHTVFIKIFENSLDQYKLQQRADFSLANAELISENILSIYRDFTEFYQLLEASTQTDNEDFKRVIYLILQVAKANSPIYQFELTSQNIYQLFTLAQNNHDSLGMNIVKKYIHGLLEYSNQLDHLLQTPDTVIDAIIKYKFLHSAFALINRITNHARLLISFKLHHVRMLSNLDLLALLEMIKANPTHFLNLFNVPNDIAHLSNQSCIILELTKYDPKKMGKLLGCSMPNYHQQWSKIIHNREFLNSFHAARHYVSHDVQ